jgi:acyl carrier protein
MTELREKVLEIIASYANCPVSALLECKTLGELPLDSIALLGAFDEIEEEFDIKLGEAVPPETTLDELEAKLARLIAAKTNA